MILNKCKSLFTCPKLLGDVEALVTDDREADLGGSSPLSKSIENTSINFGSELVDDQL